MSSTPPKTISLWGSTGSIGTQTLDVIRCFPGRFRIRVLTAHRNVSLLLKQAEQFNPEAVVVTGDVDKSDVERLFRKRSINVLFGKEGLLEAAENESGTLVVNALVGGSGLEATMKAIRAGSSIALANKEVLVMAGELVISEIRKMKRDLLPIDSEHSALFQCIQGEDMRSVRRILLTASGGPFFRKKREELERVTPKEALAHPNWNMGKKVSIDSATLMNKGLEVIEARWLFDMDPRAIEVVIHPQSIIHSMVEFQDGSIKAQMGVPDMRIPISYALTCPQRWAGDYGFMEFSKSISMEFIPPDMKAFPCLKLAYLALETGGTAPAVLNGADEAAVALFLEGHIQFPDIHRAVESALLKHKTLSQPDLETILEADRWARDHVLKLFDISKRKPI